MSAALLHRQRGLTLIEVMITLVIGLIVILGVMGIMGVNRQSLRITEGLSESQENARMAFELIARDVRQARDTSCGAVTAFSDDPAQGWTMEWWPLRGFAGDEATTAVATGAASGQRVDGTQALQLQGATNTLLIKSFPSTPLTDKVVLTAQATSLSSGKVIICSMDAASLHNVQGISGNTLTIEPELHIIDLDAPPFQVARYSAVTWYIGHNGRAKDGGRSLYRVRLNNAGNVEPPEEILPGIVEMNIRYHRQSDSDFINADQLANKAAWQTVNAIELTLVTETTQEVLDKKDAELADADRVDAETGRRLRRQTTHVIALRNNVE